jgi:hypothetical protein
VVLPLFHQTNKVRSSINNLNMKKLSTLLLVLSVSFGSAYSTEIVAKGDSAKTGNIASAVLPDFNAGDPDDIIEALVALPQLPVFYEGDPTNQPAFSFVVLPDLFLGDPDESEGIVEFAAAGAKLPAFFAGDPQDVLN